ncbi:MAG: DUF3341 domain-containing protein [Myxococcales bacterium]|nr:DUF3341 domain-containing protein [Myxococcales bacterium]
MATNDKPPALYLAEFDSTRRIMAAAEKVRDAGYKKWDVHTPFPIHGMDKAMGMPDSRLGWIVFICGLTGIIGGFTMMWWMNSVDYPLIVGGKPGFAPPSMVPILFECTVLFSAFGAVFGMFGLNQLPRHHHPVFYSDRFERASNDRFFVSIEVADPKFDVDDTRAFLESLDADYIELVRDEDAS